MKNKYGFTMMELIITVTIVVILSLISWPIYRGHRGKEYTMLAEGYALLGAIKEAQINYYNEYGYFLTSAHSLGVTNSWGASSWTAYDPVLKINSMNNRYFSWFNAYYIHVAKHSDVNNYLCIFGVASKDYGTIIQPFNLTERGEITVLNNKAITI